MISMSSKEKENKKRERSAASFPRMISHFIGYDRPSSIIRFQFLKEKKSGQKKVKARFHTSIEVHNHQSKILFV